MSTQLLEMGSGHTFATFIRSLKLITMPFDITIVFLTDSVYWSQFAIKPALHYKKNVLRIKHKGKSLMSYKQTEALLYLAMMKAGPFMHVDRNFPKVTCTITGLGKGEFIKIEHISEAIQSRSLDRGLWK